MASRSYVASLAGGTVTTTVQMQAAGILRALALSMVTVAAGSVEVSKSASSQIATAQPDISVIARMRIGATAGGNAFNSFDLNVPVKAFENIYIHQTGAGNVGEANLIVT